LYPGQKQLAKTCSDDSESGLNTRQAIKLKDKIFGFSCVAIRLQIIAQFTHFREIASAAGETRLSQEALSD